MRVTFVVPALSVVLIAGSAAGMLLENAYRSNSRMEASFCWFHICSTNELIDRARARRLELSPQAAASSWSEFQEALRRDPAFAPRWCDAAESLAILGQSGKAAYAFHRAVQLAPESPPILLQAANFAWRSGQTEDALGYSSRILHLIRDYDPVVFLSYTRSELPIATLLAGGIPDEPAPARSFFDAILSAGDLENARKVWQWMAPRRYATQVEAARYSDLLLARLQYAEVRATWGGDQIFNGGFEQAFSGSALDWNASRPEHVEEERDTNVAHDGSASLRVTFDGAGNIQYRGVWQKIVVARGVYRFTAWVKAEGISTDRGVAIRIFDPDSPARLDTRTSEVTGTSDWRTLTVEFRVNPGTNLVQCQLVREPSMKLDNRIKGTVWVDSAAFQPVLPSVLPSSGR